MKDTISVYNITQKLVFGNIEKLSVKLVWNKLHIEICHCQDCMIMMDHAILVLICMFF